MTVIAGVAGEWTEYTINMTTAGTYPIQLRVSQIATGGNYRVYIDGRDMTGQMSVPNTGSWTTYQTISSSNVYFSSGLHLMRVYNDTNASNGVVSNLDWIDPPAGGGEGDSGGRRHHWRNELAKLLDSRSRDAWAGSSWAADALGSTKLVQAAGDGGTRAGTPRLGSPVVCRARSGSRQSFRQAGGRERPEGCR